MTASYNDLLASPEENEGAPASIGLYAASPEFYASLSPNLAADLRRAAHRIKARTNTSFLETGRDLLEIKAKLAHGQFRKWLRSEFEMTPRTAARLMAAARLAPKWDIVSHLPPAVAHALAAPSVPEWVRDDLIQRIEGSERLRASDIRAAASDATPSRSKASSTRSATSGQSLVECEEARGAECETPGLSAEERKQRADKWAQRLGNLLGQRGMMDLIALGNGLHPSDLEAAVSRYFDQVHAALEKAG